MRKKILFLLLPLFAIALFFTSCEKDDNIVSTEDYIDVEITERDGGAFGAPFGHNRCFHITFPFTIEFPDGTTVTAENREELKTAIRDWKEANPDATVRPNPVFPFTIEFKDGSTQVIENQEDYASVRETCREILGDKPIRPRPHRTCFNIVYPVTLTFPDSTPPVEVSSAEEFKTAIKEWYALNEGSMDRPNIVYPFDVKMKKTGEIITLNDIDELKELHRTCKG